MQLLRFIFPFAILICYLIAIILLSKSKDVRNSSVYISIGFIFEFLATFLLILYFFGRVQLGFFFVLCATIGVIALGTPLYLISEQENNEGLRDFSLIIFGVSITMYAIAMAYDNYVFKILKCIRDFNNSLKALSASRK